MTDFQKSAALFRLDWEYSAQVQKEMKRARSIPYEDARGRTRYRDIYTGTPSNPRIELHDIVEHACVDDVYQGKCELRRQEFTPVTISKDYNGKHIMDLLNDKPGWSYKEAKMVIENEGGHIDDQHIIRR